MNNKNVYPYALFIQHLIFIQDSSFITQIIYIPFLWFLITFYCIFYWKTVNTTAHRLWVQKHYGFEKNSHFLPCPCLIWVEHLIILIVPGKCFKEYFFKEQYVTTHTQTHTCHGSQRVSFPACSYALTLTLTLQWSQFIPTILFPVFFTFLLWDTEKIPLVATGAFGSYKTIQSLPQLP